MPRVTFFLLMTHVLLICLLTARACVRTYPILFSSISISWPFVSTGKFIKYNYRPCNVPIKFFFLFDFPFRLDLPIKMSSFANGYRSPCSQEPSTHYQETKKKKKLRKTKRRNWLLLRQQNEMVSTLVKCERGKDKRQTPVALSKQLKHSVFFFLCPSLGLVYFCAFYAYDA